MALDDNALYHGIDLSSWDPRTRKLVDKYGLEKDRLECYVRWRDGNVKKAEFEYLRHVGLRVKNWAYDDINELGYSCLENCKEAEYIFNLIIELDPQPPHGWGDFANQQLEGVRDIRERNMKGGNEKSGGQDNTYIDTIKPSGPYDEVEDHVEKIDSKSKSRERRTKIKFR